MEGLLRMKASNFISVGENIHCTRIYKVGGNLVKDLGGGRWGIAFEAGKTAGMLPVPDAFTKGADWEAGKVKHCAVAIWQGNYGDSAGKTLGVEYLQSAARKQAEKGATYLDINVDEFSADVQERVRLMKWTVDILRRAVSIPMSIDSSNIETLRAGLEACDKFRGRPMANSVSLERAQAVEIAARHKAVAIASAAGETGLPATTAERLANLDRLMPRLAQAGFAPKDIHIDPLVFPISVDGNNGKNFLEAVSAIRARFGKDTHIVAGLSNVSFGMPNRKLINQVFAYMAVEAGADGGIVDPIQINVKALNSLDAKSEPFRLARALLMGEDEFGMNFIAASREGKI
ncbi:MAG: dihydropteroate synthase [Verrucomicrobiota bacterium]|nr:dihydropteroate synthase [Verrucomicrobiota bacterium]